MEALGRQFRRTLGAFLAFVVTTGCSNSSDSSPPFEADTLAGFRLGMLRPDVQTRADSLRFVLSCDTAICRPATLDIYDPGFFVLGFNGGKLTEIDKLFGRDWRGIPPDTVRRRIEAARGPALMVRDSANDLWAGWETDSVVLELICLGEDAAGCSLNLSYSTIAEKLAEKARRDSVVAADRVAYLDRLIDAGLAVQVDKTAGMQVALMDFGANPAAFIGRRVVLHGVTLVSSLGKEAYWLDMAGNVPFLVKASPKLAASGGFSMKLGLRYDIEGRIVAMTDSVLSAWEKSGAIQDEGERMQAEFAASFMEVESIK